MTDFSNIYPVILSGGSGARLWPLSRAQYPKQLLPLVGDNTMLQETSMRVSGDNGFNDPIIIANDQHRFIVADQLQQIGINWNSIILEPIGRNTAPAATLAALQIYKLNPNGLMLLLPSDHIIQEIDAFYNKLTTAMVAAMCDNLVTFGILPEYVETEYGYIKQGEKLTAIEGAFKVAKFVEKPDHATAKKLVADGCYSWNSGMFLLPVNLFLSEIERLQPDIFTACKGAILNAKKDLDFLRLDKESFSTCPPISIDYAVMEKTHHAAVVPAQIGWRDVGGWKALWKISDKDSANNVVIGNTELSDVSNSYIRSDDGKLIAAIGVDDLSIVSTEDAFLVANNQSIAKVKELVESLKSQNREEATFHRKVYRPWGNYRDIDKKEQFRVKRIVVNPGGILSLQRHQHRSEHWVVVSGSALITCGNNIFRLKENESTFIPKGETHRLENSGDTPLHMIEVQVGHYLGEDDIERLDDIYGRN